MWFLVSSDRRTGHDKGSLVHLIIPQERDDAREVIRLSVEKIKQLKAEYREKQEQWWQGEQAWREQRARDKVRHPLLERSVHAHCASSGLRGKRGN
jgi:hypothetical protein